MGKGVISLGKEKFVIESKEAQSEINFAEEVEHVHFYSRALGLLLWVRDGPSRPTRNRVPKLVNLALNYEEENDPEIDMGKFEKGRRASSSPFDAAWDGPAGAGGVRNSSGRQPSITLWHIVGDATVLQLDRQAGCLESLPILL